MSDAFVMLLAGGAYTIVVFVLGAVFEHWRHDQQQAIADMREQVIIDAMSQRQRATVTWPDKEQ